MAASKRLYSSRRACRASARAVARDERNGSCGGGGHVSGTTAVFVFCSLVGGGGRAVSPSPRQPRPRPRSFLCWCFNLSAWWAGRVGLFPGGWEQVGRTSVPRRWWWWTEGAGGTGQPRGTRWRVQTTLAGLSAHARAAGRGDGRAPPKALSPLSHSHSLLLPLPPRGLALPASRTHAPTPPATAHCAALPAVTAVPAGGAQPIPPHIPLPPPLRPPCHRPATAAMADATTRGRGLYS